jgi:hypothetical protein
MAYIPIVETRGFTPFVVTESEAIRRAILNIKYLALSYYSNEKPKYSIVRLQ